MKKFILLFVFGFSLAQAEVNVTASPIFLLAGGFSGGADFKLGSALTLGPAGTYLKGTMDDYEVKASKIGIQGKYFFNQNALTQGWYLSSSVSRINVNVEEDDSVNGKLSGEASAIGLDALIGHMWLWQNFNINLGLGLYHFSMDNIKVKNEDNTYREEFDGNLTGTGVAMEFSLGWKF